MYRTIFLFLAILLFSCKKEEKITQPNVIIIVSDDQGWGDLSFNGNTNISTPNIDKLAKEGVTFNHFYVCAVCSPTRAELLTGRYHVRGGVYGTSTGGERLDLDETTMAEVFQSAGYKTAAYGKWHNGMQPPYHPNARGFDDYYGFCSGHWGNYFSPMLEHNGKIVTGNGFVIDDFTNRGIEFIEKNKDNPFFLYLPYNTPHSPFQAPDKWWDKFENKELKLKHRDPEKEDPDVTRAALAMCENIDWNVGRVVDKIEELGLSENTIVIYFSDNGPNSWRWNGGMKGRKGSTDEGGVRSPLFMRWTKILEAGKKIDHMTSVLDLFPTLTELCDIDYSSPKKLDGKSFLPLLEHENPEWEDRFLVHHWRRTTIRNQQFRLDYEGRLFDMINDPGQNNDVSEKYPDVYSLLNQALTEWKNNVLAELPENENRPFTIGYPNFDFSQIPARDGFATGNIERSDNSPNCTYFTNWLTTKDSIYWPVEVLESGTFEVDLYYSCSEEDVGSTIQLGFGSSKLLKKITEAHNPPEKGMENDRILRTQSYIKDWKQISLGKIELEKGRGNLTLKALEISGSQVMDFRLLMFKRI